MIQLSEIWTYPIKSLNGVPLSRARVLPRGLEYDRRWMIIDEQGVFMTQRTSTELARLQLQISENTLVVCKRSDPANGFETALRPSLKREIKARIWDDIVTCWAIDPNADRWLSGYLKKEVRLVYMGDLSERQIDRKYADDKEHVSFADGYPYLLISEASLADLNSRLKDPVEMRRFRPNLVVKGTEAFEEDSWKHITIDNLSFRVVKPCARCVLTTVDPDTGEKGTEPLKTLATYRAREHKILFGQNLIAETEGVLHKSDAIQILTHNEKYFD